MLPEDLKFDPQLFLANLTPITIRVVLIFVLAVATQLLARRAVGRGF